MAWLRKNAHFLLALTLIPLVFLEWKPAPAYLPRDSEMHYLFAALSGAGFLAFAHFVFPGRSISLGSLFLSALFVGTVGILLLFAFQWVAAQSLTMEIRSGSFRDIILFYTVQLIGFSYSCINDPGAGPLLTFMGYTVGVGFCEELCKALPVLNAIENQQVFHWQDACLLGLACGAGFGVSESIHYSATQYNGQAGPDVYLIRFISLVGLHAMWTGTSAILIFQKNVSLHGSLRPLPKVLGLSLLLHGLYDTLISFDGSQLAARVTAVFSFIVFAILVQMSRSR